MHLGFDEFEALKKKISEFDQRNSGAALNAGITRAAVLVPFAHFEHELVMLFTRRSHLVNRHRGQVSFPGGLYEEADNDLKTTVLRETREEIGIQPDKIEIFGLLEPITSPQGYDIQPFLGYISDLNGMAQNLMEVERIFCIPFSWLRDPANFHQEDYQASSGEIHKVWVYHEFSEEKVWGITAAIIQQILNII